MDVTAEAAKLGYAFPDGWTVVAFVEPDEEVFDLAKEFDCYDQAAIEGFKRGDWEFVTVFVRVSDAGGRVWGSANIGCCEAGTMPSLIADGSHTVDPLRDPGNNVGELIGEACWMARREATAMPVATWPQWSQRG